MFKILGPHAFDTCECNIPVGSEQDKTTLENVIASHYLKKPLSDNSLFRYKNNCNKLNICSE